MLKFAKNTFFRSKHLDNTKICSIFASSFKKKIVRMNLKYELNEKEAELIEAIRNYRLSYPDGYPQLLWYAQQLFDDLVDMPE